MKNTFGNSISVTLFGESHGEAIGAVVDGLAPGIKIDDDYIAARLGERRPSGRISGSYNFFRCSLLVSIFKNISILLYGKSNSRIRGQ